MAPSAIETIDQYADINLYDNDNLVKLNFTPSGDSANAKALVQHALKEQIRGIDTDNCEPGEEDPFFVADMGEVYRQHMRWKMNLARVKPFYAVKCNPDPEVLKLLAALGTGFDCASKAEIDQVLNLGVDPSRIIYAQPCKTSSYVRYVAQRGVKQMTFDNADELHKIKTHFPGAELYLRILTDDSSSLCRLSLKFGASLDATEGLLSLAKSLGLNVVGVSFHVGSGASDPSCFLKAVQDARTVFDQAAALGYQLHTLDVGGGFTSELFEDMAAVLRVALETYFPPTVRVIGEPGRYFVSAAYNLACNVIARRDVPKPGTDKSSYMLYLNDGVYGNFSSIIFDHQHPVPLILRCRDNNTAGDEVEYSLWGPTCDGIDRITERCTFRRMLDVGDWLFFENMGAYTKCSATRFNGFSDSHFVRYIYSEPGAAALMRY